MGDRPGRSITGQWEASLDTAQVVLFGGGLLSVMFGLLGIAITQRDNTAIVDILNPDERKSYWTQRLITEGIALCGMCKQEFRPGPSANTTVCEVCIPPLRPLKSEPHYALEHKTRALNFGRSYRPLYMDYPDLWKKGDDND